MIVSCLLVASAAVTWLRPVLSAEVLRYRFDGRAWLLGLSPYKVSPDEAAELAVNVQDAELRPDLLDRARAHQQRTTLNLPVSQAAFVANRTLEYLSPPEAEAKGHARHAAKRAGDADWRVKLLGHAVVAADAFLAGPAGRGLPAGGRGADRVVAVSGAFAVVGGGVAWQPLGVVMEMLGAGHQDILGVLFLIAGLRRADAEICGVRRCAWPRPSRSSRSPCWYCHSSYGGHGARMGRSFIRPGAAPLPPAGTGRRAAAGIVVPGDAALLTPLYNAEAMAETWRR